MKPQKRTLGVRFEVEGALELRDLGLVEDGRELGDALVSDGVLLETVNERRDEDGEIEGVREMCQRALTQKQTLWGGGALQRGHGALLERLAQLGDALGGVGAAADIVEAAELVAGQTAMGWARR